MCCLVVEHSTQVAKIGAVNSSGSFLQKCRLSHPENYLLSLSKKHFLDQSIQKKKSFNFENRSTGEYAQHEVKVGSP